MTRIFQILTVALALAVSNGVAFAQSGWTTPQNDNRQVPNQPAKNNRPVVLQGNENLPGMGPLTFIVRDNDVEMIDASKKPVRGTGQLVGQNRIVMNFGNCVYEGDYINGVYAGTARFITGPNAGYAWNFSTRFAGNL